MVILGGLELVAAGYLVHRHQKKKRERERVEAEALWVEEQQHRHRDRKRSHSHSHSNSKHGHSHKPSRRPSCPTSGSAQKPEYLSAYPAQTHQPQSLHAVPPQAAGANGRRREEVYPPTGWPKEWESTSSLDDPNAHLPTYRPRADGHDSPSRLYSMSSPNLAPGYQSNTGLSDDFDDDELSMNGIEVYDPDAPPTPRVRFALPDQPQPARRHEPPPPYRP